MILSIEDIVKSQVEAIIPDESQYQMFATPLKPPSAFRKAHQENLMDFFKFEELHEQLEQAPKIILSLMPNYLPSEEFNKIKSELDKSINQFILVAISMSETSDKPILLQELFGITDDSLLKIYELGVDLVKKNNYKDGIALFVFLTTMSPYVPSFWIAQGVCLQALNSHEDAIELFKNAKILKPSDPVPFAYLIECYLILKKNDEAKTELEALKSTVETLQDGEKKNWEQKIKEIVI